MDWILVPLDVIYMIEMEILVLWRHFSDFCAMDDYQVLLQIVPLVYGARGMRVIAPVALTTRLATAGHYYYYHDRKQER